MKTAESVQKEGETGIPGNLLFVDGVVQLMRSFPHRPSWDEYFMATALLIASRSVCSRLRVGCVLVSTGVHAHRIIAAGYNGFLPGVPHVSQVCDGHEQATVHAEQNAVTDASRRGVSVDESIAYITHFPCMNCAKILASSGIKGVKYAFDYCNNDWVCDLFSQADISITKLCNETVK